MGLILFLLFLASSQIALGVETSTAIAVSATTVAETVIQPNMYDERGFFDFLAKPDFLARIMGFVTAMYFFMYGLAEALTRFSVWTENKTDNKLAQWISDVTWILGSVIGKFGYSIPKLVLEEKAKVAAAAAATPPQVPKPEEPKPSV